jgi:hypothetical protein
MSASCRDAVVALNGFRRGRRIKETVNNNFVMSFTQQGIDATFPRDGATTHFTEEGT